MPPSPIAGLNGGSLPSRRAFAFSRGARAARPAAGPLRTHALAASRHDLPRLAATDGDQL
ncbi:hypothetical protein [Sphaerisporangium album]|uniref:hypothetical protein n=1 Tax=Sphaerisporangium album TaxID=509200 RepID=UPI0011C01BB8|nr:hypothetical protein [Sphaerisporangium album]